MLAAFGLLLLVTSVPVVALWSWARQTPAHLQATGRSERSATATPGALQPEPQGNAPEAAQLQEAVALEWPQNTRLSDGVDVLEALGLPGGTARLRLYALLTGDPLIEAGRHWLKRELSVAEVLRCLRRSAARPRVQVTIPEGFTLFQIAERLGAVGVTEPEAFVGVALGSAPPEYEARSWEGFLFPSSYELYLNTSADRVVHKLAAEMEQRWLALSRTQSTSGKALQEEFGWGLPQVLALASMVQAEGAEAAEFPHIASVFINRLRTPSFQPKGMLQSDPTARYGCRLHPVPLPSCADAVGNVVTPRMLRDAANPYNTYRHAGLPPGPIGNPGEAAIRAVLEPAPSADLYFVADGHGGHRFSQTYEQHVEAIANSDTSKRPDSP